MRQYTTPEQTTKLIELGFEKPKGYGYMGKEEDSQVMQIFNSSDYSIGELIGMLPEYIHIYNLRSEFSGEWFWNVTLLYRENIKSKELVDALFDLIVELKEEGVI